MAGKQIQEADRGSLYDGSNHRPAATGCGDADLDADGDVDLIDFAAFRNCFNVSNRPPTCPATTRPMRYTWDGENRLKAVYPTSPGSGSKKLTFAYDYMGRRVQKQVYNRSGSAWVLETDLRFVYDGWNVVMQINHLWDDWVEYECTWGLDLSGLQGAAQGAAGFSPAGIHGAGGIGGLLACEEPQTTGDPKRYWFFYDGNGNVAQVLKYVVGETPTITRVAHYEYDPYGNAITTNNDVCDLEGTVLTPDAGYANDNPFRFSTKWLDDESGTYYYIFRPYWPRLGRWGSRDPIGEQGGLNLYAFLENRVVNAVDPKGLVRMVWLPPVFVSLNGAYCGCKSCAQKEKTQATLDSDVFGNNMGLQSSRIDGQLDAYRHCLGACRVKRNCGTACAFFAGWGNEINGHWRTPTDNGGWMDLGNNAKGREAADNPGSCEWNCQNMLISGDLTIVNCHGNLGPSDDPCPSLIWSPGDGGPVPPIGP